MLTLDKQKIRLQLPCRDQKVRPQTFAGPPPPSSVIKAGWQHQVLGPGGEELASAQESWSELAVDDVMGWG